MPGSRNNMGIHWVPFVNLKRTHRFLLSIWGVTIPTNDQGAAFAGGNPNGTLNVMIHEKASRPSFSFKEEEAKHLTETIYFPGRPEYKPLKITLMDTINAYNPVAEWLGFSYGTATNRRGFKLGQWFPSLEFADQPNPSRKFKRDVTVTSLDGKGIPLDQWFYYNAWPQNVEFGDFDMTTSDIMRITLDLRFDRAEYISCNRT